jgi:hypothetical protein
MGNSHLLPHSSPISEVLGLEPRTTSHIPPLWAEEWEEVRTEGDFSSCWDLSLDWSGSNPSSLYGGKLRSGAAKDLFRVTRLESGQCR